MEKRTLAIKFDREKFGVKEVADIMNLIYNQIDDTIQIIPIFDGMTIGTIKFIDMESMNKIPLSSYEDFDEWQEKLP